MELQTRPDLRWQRWEVFPKIFAARVPRTGQREILMPQLTLLHEVCAPFILGTDFNIHSVSLHDVHLAAQIFMKATRWQRCMVATTCLERSTLAGH